MYKRHIHSITKRTVGDQLGGSDHRPVYLTLDTKTTTASTVPRWNYKKADWKAYSHRSSILTNAIQTYERDINKVTKEFCTGILYAAKECIYPKELERTKYTWEVENNDLGSENIAVLIGIKPRILYTRN